VSARADEVQAVLRQLTDWARRRPDVRALALVGSWARGTPHDESDVDVVLLTDSPESYVRREDWLAEVGGVHLVRTRNWGGVTERRFALQSGLEVELGVGTPGWASVDPLDEGTRGVVSDGMRVLHDPDGLLASLAGRLEA
jgi:predicted nucleotidyltransferase